MSKAEERAFKAYPVKNAERDGYDENLRERKGFVKGYHQAEKDKELTWRDIEQILDIINNLVDENFNADDFGIPANKEFYQEVLKRFNKERKEK